MQTFVNAFNKAQENTAAEKTGTIVGWLCSLKMVDRDVKEDFVTF